MAAQAVSGLPCHREVLVAQRPQGLTGALLAEELGALRRNEVEHGCVDQKLALAIIKLSKDLRRQVAMQRVFLAPWPMTCSAERHDSNSTPVTHPPVAWIAAAGSVVSSPAAASAAAASSRVNASSASPIVVASPAGSRSPSARGSSRRLMKINRTPRRAYRTKPAQDRERRRTRERGACHSPRPGCTRASAASR